jgi:hypothetical protein
MKNISIQVLEFLKLSYHNKWLCDNKMAVYVRKGHHIGSDNKMHLFFDIASVEVKEKFQKQGIFKNFLLECQKIQLYDGIFIENVLNEHLKKYLQRLANEDSRWTEKDSCFIWEIYT